MKHKKDVAIILLVLFVVGFLTGMAAYNFRFLIRSHFDLPEGFTVTAHTGSMKTEDNSLESIRVGLENADIIEFDVLFNSEGVPVLAHDNPENATVTLEEAFVILSENKSAKANVDLKTDENLDKIQLLAEKYNVLDQIFFTGVKEEKVDAVKTLCPKIKFYLNFEPKKLKCSDDEYISEVIAKVKGYGAVGLNCPFGKVTGKFVSVCRENGLSVSLWTAKNTLQSKKILALSPDNITTRIPDKVNEIIESK